MKTTWLKATLAAFLCTASATFAGTIHVAYDGDGKPGPGAYVTAGGVITNCRVTATVTTSNSDRHFGGAVSLSDATAVDCLIDGNTLCAYYRGMAIYCTGASSLIDRCVITNNHATAWNGTDSNWAGSAGVYVSRGLVRNCLIAHNYAGKTTACIFNQGVGVYISGGVLANSLVHDNTYDGATTSFIGGVNAVGGSVVNCIIS